MRRIAICSLLLCTGCITVIRPVMTPWPCDQIGDVLGLTEEMQMLKANDEYRVRVGEQPVTQTIRSYAKQSSAKCAADMELGAKRLTPEMQKAWFGARFWRWLTRE